MTNPREIMAAALWRNAAPMNSEMPWPYPEGRSASWIITDGQNEARADADACLAALTAAGFEVRRRMYVAHGDGITDDTEAMQAALDGREVRRREKLRERIADVIWKSDAFVDGRFDAERLADDVLAVLDGQEP